MIHHLAVRNEMFDDKMKNRNNLNFLFQDPIANASNAMVLDHVNAFKIIMEIRTKDVGQNAFYHLNVPHTKLALGTNVKILALEFAV